MIKKRLIKYSLWAFVFALLVACGDQDQEEDLEVTADPEQEVVADDDQVEETLTEVTYLGETYPVDGLIESLVITGSMEAMEDALLLEVEPTGAITVGGAFPDLYQSITTHAEAIGEKQQPNVETILQLDPDLILSTAKFPEDVATDLDKVATTIPVSHIASNWQENLKLLAAVTGKTSEAESILEDYAQDLESVKADIADELAEEVLVMVRIRNGNIMIYPEDVYFNDLLYDDLGLEAPEAIQAAEAQEVISLEMFSDLNPDYVFVQMEKSQNQDQPDVIEELENNPIWQSIEAVKNDQVYLNSVDPLLEGGTAYSRITFLDVINEKIVGN
ncbi:ABC transporter substrate-binding protein [Amphibacillus cookii]|uniref:ABC transporter substrate-binding protein n=1 Tax=Amphibacillus cookii TaxID=767787 RepID=UPI00195CDBFF|nr:ABC transporter substrate-binding protein [Amphibacillus cookii]MBM7542347.1 iron complex transport system substrate-binding protein [Amphibacillus cookii]